MNKVAYQRASRSPNVPANDERRTSVPGTCLAPPLAEDIADASHRLKQLLVERLVDLFAQAADEHVDDVGLRIEVVVPDVRQDHRFRHDLAGVAHQILEQGELSG